MTRPFSEYPPVKPAMPDAPWKLTAASGNTEANIHAALLERAGQREVTSNIREIEPNQPPIESPLNPLNPENSNNQPKPTLMQRVMARFGF